MATETSVNYEVTGVKVETSDTSTITLKSQKGAHPSFIAGQYINIYFKDTGTPEGKAYTISSAPTESRFSITVKAIGEFSNRLVSLKVGDVIEGSLPYGYFYSEATDTHLVLIAGGIGVNPFRSVIIESLVNNRNRKIDLFVSTRTQAEALFVDDFKQLSEKYPDFKWHQFVTREEVNAGVTKGRISGEEILKRINNTSDTEFFICGSISFVRDLWRQLKESGVKEEMICTEAFFSH